MREAIYSPHHDFYIDWAVRTGGYDMPSFHLHKKYELYFQVDGPRRYSIEDASYLVNAGSMVVIGPDSVHKATSIENRPHSRYVINFSQDFLHGMTQALPGVDLFACFVPHAPVVSIPPKRQATVQALCERLWTGYGDETPHATAVRRVCLADLLLLLAEIIAEAGEKRPERITNPLIDQIQSHLATHYDERLTLSGIAAQFYISPAYLSRLFKRTTNLSLIEYINSIRLTAARNLLETTPLKIAQVAEKTGFSTTTHFSRIFKQATGFSPQQYRKLYHK